MKRNVSLKSSSEITREVELKAGAAVVSIVPPLEVGLLMSSKQELWESFQSVRTDLKARVLVLESGDERVALVALDLLGLHDKAVGGWLAFKRALAQAASNVIAPEKIVLACTHTHNSPEGTTCTNLYKTRAFQNWLAQWRSDLGCAIFSAVASLQPCSLKVAAKELRGFSLQRRVPTESGIVMSDSLQPIAPRLMTREPMDHRVRGLWFNDENGQSIATLVHAICHPVHEMCQRHVSADFPGEMCAALEAAETGTPIFFNGAAGDINPPTVSDGAEAAQRHGRALAQAVQVASRTSQSVQVNAMALHTRSIKLPTRTMKNAPSKTHVAARLAVLRLGDVGVVFLPGEIFIETALKIEKASPFSQTLVVGFAENSIGYVPTQQAFLEGGYEIGPGKWSFLQASAETVLRNEAIRLLEKAWRSNPAVMHPKSDRRRPPAFTVATI